MGKWYYLDASLEKIGPVSAPVLKTLAANGVINRLTTLISEDGSKMYEAGNVKGLFTESSSVAPSVPPKSAPVPVVSPPPLPAAPWNSFEPQVETPSVFPNLSSSGFDFPFPTQSVGPTIAYQPQSSRSVSRTSFGFGIRLEFIILMLCLSVLVKVGRVVAFLSSGPATASVVAEEEQPEDAHAMIAFQAAPSVNPPTPAAPNRVVPPPSPRPTPPRTGITSPPKPSETKKTWFDAPEKSEPLRNTDPKPKDHEMLPPSVPGKPLEFGELPPQRQGTKSTEEIVAEVEGSVAVVSGQHSSGSAFVVLPGIIATNSHVIDSEEIDDLEVVFPSGTETQKGPFKAALLYEDPERDIAFLKISTQDHDVLPTVRDYKFRRGQKVIAIGSPGRGDGKVLENAVSEGILSTQTEVADQQYYQLSMAINPGNSGGPILDTEGNVLGIVRMTGAKTEGLAYCIPPDDLNLALEVLRQTDTEKVRQVNEQHRLLIPMNRGIEKMGVVAQLPATVLSDPPEKIRELARSALQDFNEAVRVLPNDVRAYVGRAIFKMVLDDFPGALSDLDTAVRLVPDSQEILEFRNLVRQELEQRRQVAGGHSASPIPIRPITAENINRLRPPIPSLPQGPGQRGMRPPRPGEHSDSLRSRLRPPETGGPPILEDNHRQQVPVESEESRALKESRYQEILAKEVWTFQGQTIRGTIVGYADGIVRIKPKDAPDGAVPIERYANRFSPQDIEAIRFYAAYHGIPFESSRRR